MPCCHDFVAVDLVDYLVIYEVPKVSVFEVRSVKGCCCYWQIQTLARRLQLLSLVEHRIVLIRVTVNIISQY